MRIGVDVGGTNTDAAVLDGRAVVATTKEPTTVDVTSGMNAALEAVVADIDPAAVEAVMLGTTHFANAVVERRRLTPTAVIRLCRPATEALPPLIDWPADLVTALAGPCYLVAGGHEFDGRPISDLDEAEVRRIGKVLRDDGVVAAAVCGVFSPVSADMEERAAALLREVHPDLAVTCSVELGRIGLLERENAAALNAALTGLADDIVNALKVTLRRLGLQAPMYLTQNDGTLMAADYATRYPVLTFSSGPTNSMRGAVFLSGQTDAIVVDIGGTTTDVGMVAGGFPREAAASVQIGGVRTNFRMPDVTSLGLGGGSLVTVQDVDGRSDVTVGPRSVGYRLTREARVFGGRTLTATDLAVAAGRARLGDPQRLMEVNDGVVVGGTGCIDAMLSDSVDRMKLAAAPMPAVLVGGGSILAPEHLPGTSHVEQPRHHDVANAIGAAIAQAGGEVDRVFALAEMEREEAVGQAMNEAAARARAAGAAEDTIHVVDVEEVPVAYLPGSAVRIRVRAVGDLPLGEQDTTAGFPA